jgi:hypothetical protein
VRPDSGDEAPRHGCICWIRQWIEPVDDTSKAAWCNWVAVEAAKRSLTGYDN